MADWTSDPVPLPADRTFWPLEDYGLIGDGRTAALVARDGSVGWLCLPRFDAAPVLAGLLGPAEGGHFVVAPEALQASRQRYEPDTGVLVSELHADGGVVEITDFFPVRAGADLHDAVSSSRGELVRRVRVLGGRVDLRVALRPRGSERIERYGGGWRLRLRDRPELDLHLFASHPLRTRGSSGPDDDRARREVTDNGATSNGATSDGAGLDGVVRLHAGDRFHLTLRWAGGARAAQLRDPDRALAETTTAWRSWAGDIAYDGPRPDLVRRSAVTLKLLDHWENGAIVAAPTSSLPETIGGQRNWDYRYTWVRDAAFSVYALRRIGLPAEADSFLAWVLDAVEREGRPRILYDLDGGQPPPERIDEALEGYRGSRPVRWGNAAADQLQLDVYGEILDCAYQWVRAGQAIDSALWERLTLLIEAAADRWREPDHGIWEVRTSGRPFTYSVAMCAVALDRGARLAGLRGADGDARRWRRRADEVRTTLLREAWDDGLGSFTEHLGGSPHGGGGLDASLLTLPLRRLLPADDPRMVATTRAVMNRLGAGKGLLYRYLPDESPDGLPGEEGAFLLCSFWLVDNLTGQGRLDEAMSLYEDLCDRAGPLGLLPEQIDPATGAFLGNYPQAFSSVGVVSSGTNLARALARQKGTNTSP